MTMHQATEPQTTTEFTLPPVTPSKSRLLRRYFFPLRKLPENTGCMAELVTTFFPDAFSGTKRKVEKISDYRQHFHKLFKDWGFADLEKEESKSITREEYRAWIDAWRHRELTDLPPDIQVDNWLEEDLANITQHGLSKLGLSIQDLVEPTEWSDILDTKAQNPMMIYGPLLTKKTTIPENENVYTIGKDGKLRFSCYEVMLVALTQSRIATYTCHYNFMRDSIAKENAKEFLYRDVVSVSTEEVMSEYKFKTGESLSIRRQFKLAVASGDNIIVSIASPEIRQKLGAEPVLSNHDESVRAIREMLRSKKDTSAPPLNKVITPEQPDVSESDPVAKLAKLKQMLDAQLITQEEYDSKKKDILSKL